MEQIQSSQNGMTGGMLEMKRPFISNFKPLLWILPVAGAVIGSLLFPGPGTAGGMAAGTGIASLLGAGLTTGRIIGGAIGPGTAIAGNAYISNAEHKAMQETLRPMFNKTQNETNTGLSQMKEQMQRMGNTGQTFVNYPQQYPQQTINDLKDKRSPKTYSSQSLKDENISPKIQSADSNGSLKQVNQASPEEEAFKQQLAEMRRKTLKMMEAQLSSLMNSNFFSGNYGYSPLTYMGGSFGMSPFMTPMFGKEMPNFFNPMLMSNNNLLKD
ncbi:MAG: hypothetical protein HYU63_03320 [Armatimonadetes bacterium]|nr:hypothetical protein [Armatimonadota bacterium]